MGKKLLFLMVLMTVFASFAVFAASGIDLSKIKTEDLRLERGQNTSLILGPGSPFSIRLYENTKVEFEMDNMTNWVVFDKLGDTATIRYTIDAGKTVKEVQMKLGSSERWMVTTGSLFVFLNYKIYNSVDKNAIFEIGIPYLERSEVPVEVDNNATDNPITAPEKTASSSDKYLKYLIGIIIVLALVLVILGPRKKGEESRTQKEAEEPKETAGPKKTIKTPKKGGKAAATKKNYYTKPKRKSFDEEDVYVVKPSDEE